MKVVDATPVSARMVDLVSALHDALAKLSTELSAESKSLADPAIGDLDKNLSEKQRLLQTIDDLERLRRSICENAGLAPEPEAMLSHIDSFFKQQPLAENWESVMELLERCQQQNLTNGAILHLRRRFASNALGVLRGNSSDDVYSATGSVAAYSSTNTRFLSA